MARRCPASRMIGRARLMRHALVIIEAGYASVARHPSQTVHGLLYDLALADVAALDRYENVAHGLYAKTMQPVLREAGGAVRALVYVGRGRAGGRALPGYMDGVIAAGRAAGLPYAYMDRQRAMWQVGAGTPTQNADAPKVRPRFATPFDRR